MTAEESTRQFIAVIMVAKNLVLELSVSLGPSRGERSFKGTLLGTFGLQSKDNVPAHEANHELTAGTIDVFFAAVPSGAHYLFQQKSPPKHSGRTKTSPTSHLATSKKPVILEVTRAGDPMRHVEPRGRGWMAKASLMLCTFSERVGEGLGV